MVLAHGLGGRSDLPVPLWLALYGGGAAVVVSFVALGVLWPTPRLDRDTGGGPLPGGLQRLVDAAATTVVLRVVGLALLGATIAAAAFGGGNSANNPAPTWLYVWLWVGLVPASLLLGPVWRRMNPLRVISATLARLFGDPHEQGVRPLPPALGYWPAVVGLLVFLWLELVYDRASQPSTVLFFVGVYGMVQVAASTMYGQTWYARGDAFEVYSTLLARLAPWGRRADGRIVARNPLRGLADLTVDSSLTAVVYVLLGSAAFDGLTRTVWWEQLTAGHDRLALAVIGTLGLAGAIGVVAVTYVAATRGAATLATPRPDARWMPPPKAFAHSLVPITVGYTIAHYFSLLIFQGQAGYTLASDPLNTGANLLGTADWQINYTAVSPQTIALVQVAAIVAGHVVGVVAAHDRAVGLFRRSDTTRAQYPLLAVMVLYTIGGIALLVGA
ncbi:MAG: hypothetical protein GEU74_14825 [Nitriliruptorales bacterium]|nr:hypothetical protein [Nitriliruptorales bacterium]